MPTLLFEIGCEELPALRAREAARGSCRSSCARTSAATASRRSSSARGGSRSSSTSVPERGGPVDRRRGRQRRRLRDDGAPTQAAEGFARSTRRRGRRARARDGFVWVEQRVAGRTAAEVLPERARAVVARARVREVDALGRRAASASRGPSAGSARSSTARRSRSSVDGVPSGGTSHGHRFTAGRGRDPARGPSTPSAARAQASSRTTRAPRRDRRAALDALGEWQRPGRRAREVVHLVERPPVLDGTFDERFLELPMRVVVTACSRTSATSRSAGNRFAFVANGGDPDVVRAGNERVLAGRLDDAAFTFERDSQRGHRGAARGARLDHLPRAGRHVRRQVRAPRGAVRAARRRRRVASRRRGSPRPTRRPSWCASSRSSRATSAPSTRAARAPRGGRGRDRGALPARRRGRALPQTAGGPRARRGGQGRHAQVAFALGERPTGSRDPYGLRRAAIGLCRLAVEAGLEIDLAALVERDLALLTGQGAEVTDDPTDVWDFVLERLEGLLDVPVEFVRAARARRACASSARRATSPRRSPPRARLGVLRRCVHRVRPRATGSPAGRTGPRRRSIRRLATEPAEDALVEALAAAGPQIEAAVRGAATSALALAAAAELGPPVDRFFDEVLVMAEDPPSARTACASCWTSATRSACCGDLSQIPPRSSVPAIEPTPRRAARRLRLDRRDGRASSAGAVEAQFPDLEFDVVRASAGRERGRRPALRLCGLAGGAP